MVLICSGYMATVEFIVPLQHLCSTSQLLDGNCTCRVIKVQNIFISSQLKVILLFHHSFIPYSVFYQLTTVSSGVTYIVHAIASQVIASSHSMCSSYTYQDAGLHTKFQFAVLCSSFALIQLDFYTMCTYLTSLMTYLRQAKLIDLHSSQLLLIHCFLSTWGVVSLIQKQ